MKLQPSKSPWEKEVAADTSSIDDLYITQEQARMLLDANLKKAGIPPQSTTARCVFEKTKDGRGNNRCKFGNTPLWQHLRVVRGKVLRSEFMDLVQKLCDSGQDHQRAGRASWAR